MTQGSGCLKHSSGFASVDVAPVGHGSSGAQGMKIDESVADFDLRDYKKGVYGLVSSCVPMIHRIYQNTPFP